MTSSKLGLLVAAATIAGTLGPSLALAADTDAVAKRQFLSGYLGSPGADPRNHARTYFKTPSVKALIFEMESGPVARARVEQAVQGSGFTVADLERVRLVRERQGRFFLDFAYFTAADVKLIAAVAEHHVPSLVQAFAKNREAYDRIYATYPVKSVAKDRLAFVLISGFTLNWEGLKLTEELGYRRPAFASGDGWKYAFWAAEDIPERSTREFYWGSTTMPATLVGAAGPADDFAFSSFGDPFSDPRMSLPDLLMTQPKDMAPPIRDAATRVGLVHETQLGFDLDNVLGLKRARDLGAVLFAVRAGASTDDALRAVVQDRASLTALMSLLDAAQYVQRHDGRYELLVPVFDVADRKMVDESMALSRRILTAWLEENLPKIRQELAGLTGMKNGVPFEALFTQIWHDLFGLATKQLARAGVTMDPYGQQLTYKASFPAVWRTSVYAYPGL